jgi:signal transduction histidine kinase
VSKDIRDPLLIIISQLEDLANTSKNQNKIIYNIARKTLNQSKLFICLLDDMQDIFHIKNNKFVKREKEMIVQNIIDYIIELFHQ